MSRPAELTARLLCEQSDGSLATFCAEVGIDVLVLFGSAAVSPETAGDVDLAYSVDFTRPAAGRPSHLDVAAAFLSRYGEGIDLMCLDTAGTVARAEALFKGTRLVDLHEPKAAELQMRAGRDFVNEAPRRAFELRTLQS